MFFVGLLFIILVIDTPDVATDLTETVDNYKAMLNDKGRSDCERLGFIEKYLACFVSR